MRLLSALFNVPSATNTRNKAGCAWHACRVKVDQKRESRKGAADFGRHILPETLVVAMFELILEDSHR